MEVIVVDDSSNTETQLLLHSQNLPIRYIKSGSSRGAPHARNVGIFEAKGDFIAFLDDDDAWLPAKIERQLKLAGEHALVSCQFQSRRGDRVRLCRLPERVALSDLLTESCLGGASMVMLDARLAKASPFDEGLVIPQDD
jgi:glycosyltransferase involved in cell wall biosynthesis